jgi:hypothetical protein
MSATLVRVRVGGTLLAGVALLSACGGRFVPPAAIVNGEEITQADLRDRVREFLANPEFAVQARGPKGDAYTRDLTRRVLGALIRQRVIAEYAVTKGTTVTSQEVDQQVDAIIQRVGGPVRFRQALKKEGLTLGELRRDIHEGLLLDKVRREVVGPAAADPNQAQVVFSRWLGGRLSRARIEVNPRFGTFDPKSPDVVAPLNSTALLTG